MTILEARTFRLLYMYTSPYTRSALFAASVLLKAENSKFHNLEEILISKNYKFLIILKVAVLK